MDRVLLSELVCVVENEVLPPWTFSGGDMIVCSSSLLTPARSRSRSVSVPAELTVHDGDAGLCLAGSRPSLISCHPGDPAAPSGIPGFWAWSESLLAKPMRGRRVGRQTHIVPVQISTMANIAAKEAPYTVRECRKTMRTMFMAVALWLVSAQATRDWDQVRHTMYTRPKIP